MTFDIHSEPEPVEDIATDDAETLRGLIGKRLSLVIPATLIGVGKKGATFEVAQTFGDPYQFSARDFAVLDA